MIFFAIDKSFLECYHKRVEHPYIVRVGVLYLPLPSDPRRRLFYLIPNNTGAGVGNIVGKVAKQRS